MSNAAGYALLLVAAVVVILITASPDWNARRVDTVYHECLMTAQTPADAKACDPASSAPTPGRR